MSGIDFTDKFFQQTLANLSVHNSLFFTERQLYYFFNHRRNLNKWDPLQVAGIVAIFAVVVVAIVWILTGTFSGLGFVLLLLVVVPSIALVASSDLRKRLQGVRPQEASVTPDKVDAWFRRWTKINGPDKKLLPPPAKEIPKAEVANISPELKNYSFDRAVVCDHPQIAQCLIANKFHFEHNCAVLALDGYPHDIFSTVMGMLRQNPDLSVYALHDASIRGIELTHTLRNSEQWFAGSTAKIFDLGLMPRQIFNRSVFVEKSFSYNVPAHVAATLQPEEVRWLEAGNSVELESFTPKMLMHVVAQGIARSRDPQAADALVPVTSDSGTDGGFFIYTFDTFG
jgi:hypothetical protein